MKNIDQMIDDVIRREGGYVDHPADRGGPTKYGITLRTLQARWADVDVTAEDVASINKAFAAHLYRTDFYRKPKISLLPEGLQPVVFDSAVNHGPPRAIMFLQQACNEIDRRPPLVVDGICGPATRQRAAELWVRDEIELLEAYLDQRYAFYNQIVDNDPSQEVFLGGWLARLQEFEPQGEEGGQLSFLAWLRGAYTKIRLRE